MNLTTLTACRQHDRKVARLDTARQRLLFLTAQPKEPNRGPL